MSEGETSIELGIKTSVGYAFSSKVSPEQVQARKRIEQETRGLRDKLRGMVKEVAHKARERGVFTELAQDVERRMASGIWKTAQERAQERLSKEAALGNMQWVMATLYDLDPMDVEVEDINAKLGKPATWKVRRSVGLSPNAEINFHRVNPDSPLPDNQKDVKQIIIGGHSFRKEAVRRVLSGEGSLNPMWRGHGVDLFLCSSDTGEVHDVSLSTDQVKMLQARLEVQEKGFINDEQLKSIVKNLIKELVSSVEQSGSKDGMSGRRFIVVPGLMFQGRTYGKETSAADEDLFRVYFQVEIEDIPRMVEILKEMGEDRAQTGEGIDFKFLLGAAQKPDFSDYQSGDYHNLEDGDPRVVAYFDSPEQQKGFIRELLENPQYKKDLIAMSEKRKNPDGSLKARRPGSSVWYDNKTGEELRAINYTKGGHSRDVVRRHGVDDWRKHVRGRFTGPLVT